MEGEGVLYSLVYCNTTRLDWFHWAWNLLALVYHLSMVEDMESME